jgi:hypothetical protein
MDNENDSKSFIKEKLDVLDNSKSKYKNLINIKDVEFEVDNDFTKIIFKKNNENLYSGKCSLLGVFDVNAKLWIWSWCLPTFSYDETSEARKILNYGLMLEPNTNSLMHYYIKSHLVNSRLYFENDIFLDIHLGLSIYLSKAKFIYPKVKGVINGKELIVYYLVY